jgi:hypothetical protein
MGHSILEEEIRRDEAGGSVFEPCVVVQREETAQESHSSLCVQSASGSIRRSHAACPQNETGVRVPKAEFALIAERLERPLTLPK